jgi:hypothetical protein
MSIDTKTELARFRDFLSQLVAQGDAGFSPEEALDLWREQNPCTEEYAATVAALNEALDDMAAGDTGRPLGEFDQEFRKRHNIGPLP